MLYSKSAPFKKVSNKAPATAAQFLEQSIIQSSSLPFSVQFSEHGSVQSEDIWL